MYAHKQTNLYLCDHIKILKTWYGFVLPLTVCLWAENKKHLRSTEQLWNRVQVFDYRQAIKHTDTHRHDTGGFGTLRVFLLLGIFQHRKRAGVGTGQTHSCLRLPPLLEVRRYRLSDRHIAQPSHSNSTKLCGFLLLLFCYGCCCFFESQPLTQSVAPGCPHSWALEGSRGTGRPWSRGSLLLWQRWGGC